MDSKPWYKQELAIAVLLISGLLSLALWFAKVEMQDKKAQDKAQWSEAAKTRQCLEDKISALAQRLSHSEGYREGYRDAEKDYGCKTRDK
jgi:hypothetical protein